MVELQQQGILERYQGASWERIPERYRDADGYWVGFAARMRVYIVNSHKAAATEETLGSLFTLEPSRVAMAKPLFGTTLTHYTVLWHLWGGDRLKMWHRDLRLRGLREVDGNAAVKDIVAQETCDAGLTDTDDVFVAIDDGLPVEMFPIRITAERQPPLSRLKYQALLYDLHPEHRRNHKRYETSESGSASGRLPGFAQS